MDKVELNPRWMKILLGLGCGAFALSLASFAYSGYFSRYLADDYCKPLYARFNGFWKGQWVAWQIVSGRFMVTFLTSVFELLGPFFIRLTPALVIILWTVGMSLFFLRARRFLPFRVPAAVAWICGMLVTLSSIVGAPTRLQSLYWRDGMFNYTFPMVFFSVWLIIGEIQLERQQPRWSLWLSAVGCALFAFFAGGCNETFAAFEIVLCLIAMAFVLFTAVLQTSKRGAGGQHHPFFDWLKGRAMLLLIISLAGALAALLLNWLAPSYAGHQAHFQAPPNLITLIRLSLRYGYIFMRTYTNLMKLVTIMTIGIPALLVVYYFQGKNIAMNWWQGILAFVLVLLVGYALLVTVCAPSAYGETSYPDGRVLMIGRFSLVLTMMELGGVIGLLLCKLAAVMRRLDHRLLNAAILAGLTVLCLYSLVVSWQINRKEIPPRQAWAAAWDKRDAQLREAAAQGKTSVNVVEFQSWETLFEIGPDPHQWLNVCAAQFYGLKSIIATPPK